MDPQIFSNNPSDLVILLQVIGAAGALGAAAFGLVDASKAWGGVAEIGYGRLLKCLNLYFAPALQLALGEKGDWRQVIHAHWLNGRSRDEQKAIIRSLIRLGIAPSTADSLAAAGHVDPIRLHDVAEKLQTGAPLDEADVNVIGRLDASIEAHLDAAFDMAEQQYRNTARLIAGIVAVLLAVLAGWLLNGRVLDLNTSLLAMLVGLVAVPLAPLAKDLSSSLSAAARAVKAAKG